jgi:4-hydroxy-2-oxoheptanedioate aldolase
MEVPSSSFSSLSKEAMTVFSYQPKLDEGMQAYRAPSLFQPHRARQALRDAHAGKIRPLCGLYLGLSSVPTARFIAPMGFDVVWVDWEHSSCNVETMTTMVHEIMWMSEGRTIPFVRVPGHDHAA